MLDKKMGERIRLARRAQGMTQEVLAELSGFSHKSAINKIETGQNGLSEKKLQAVADALQVSVYYLKTGIQPPNEPTPLKGWTQELAETAANLSKPRRQMLIEFVQFLSALDKRDREADVLAAEETAKKPSYHSFMKRLKASGATAVKHTESVEPDLQPDGDTEPSPV